MPERDLSLADSTSLVKDDPSVAAAILDPYVMAERALPKLKKLAAHVTRQVPDIKAPPIDPLDYLQRAIAIILEGKGNRGISLSRVAELTHRHDPLTRCYWGLKAVRRTIEDISEMQEVPFSCIGGSSNEKAAASNSPSRKHRELVFLGYQVDVPALRSAVRKLQAIEQKISSAHPQRAVFMACLAMVQQALHQLQPYLTAAGDDWIEMLRVPGNPGGFSIKNISPVLAVAEVEPPTDQADSIPDLTDLEKLLWWLDEMITRRGEAGEPMEISHAEAIRMVGDKAARLYERATKAKGVAEVHLAVRRWVDRKQHALAVAGVNTTGVVARTEFLLLAPLAKPVSVDEAANT